MLLQLQKSESWHWFPCAEVSRSWLVGPFLKLSSKNLFPSLSIQGLPACSLTYSPHSIFGRYYVSCSFCHHIFIRRFSCFHWFVDNITQCILNVFPPSPPSSQIHPFPAHPILDPKKKNYNMQFVLPMCPLMCGFLLVACQGPHP